MLYKTEYNHLLERLGEEIDKHVERIEDGELDESDELIEIHYLFY